MAAYSEVVRSRMTPSVGPQAPEGYERRLVQLVNGLPATIDLDRDLSLVLIAPSGLAATWRDEPGDAVVSTSEDERRPRPDPSQATPAPVGAVERFPLRLVERFGGTVGAAVPLTAGVDREVPDSGGASNGVVADVALLSWDIRAGTLRGSGDFGSRIELAWRRADGDNTDAEPTPPHRRVLERIGAGL
jgi:hypothetical protein